jgi:hypothetical protein
MIENEGSQSGRRIKNSRESPGYRIANVVLVFRFPPGAVEFGGIGAETGVSG